VNGDNKQIMDTDCDIALPRSLRHTLNLAKHKVSTQADMLRASALRRQILLILFLSSNHFHGCFLSVVFPYPT
jgi:hypothetical protein